MENIRPQTAPYQITFHIIEEVLLYYSARNNSEQQQHILASPHVLSICAPGEDLLSRLIYISLVCLLSEAAMFYWWVLVQRNSHSSRLLILDIFCDFFKDELINLYAYPLGIIVNFKIKLINSAEKVLFCIKIMTIQAKSGILWACRHYSPSPLHVGPTLSGWAAATHSLC